MLDNRRLLVTVTSLAIAGVLALFAYSTTISPEYIALEDIGTETVGQVITTNGTISSSRMLSDGSVAMEIVDLESGRTLDVYFPASAYSAWEGGNLTPGTVVRATGELMLYQEELELSVASAGDIVVLEEAESVVYKLWDIMPSIQMMDGMTVRTNGTILDISPIYNEAGLVGTSFNLHAEHLNQTYSLECMCFNRTLEQFENWDNAIVTGKLSFYNNKGCWQLVVDIIEPIPETI